MFDQMADILEILDEDVFRINSYRKVARVLGDTPEDIATLAAEDRLDSLAGVGKSSAQKIHEFLDTGTLAAYRELFAKIPAGLLDLLKIPGFGPKGVRAVWQQLNVSNLADLRRVIENKQLEELPGFGPKKAAALAQGIAFIEAGAGRVLLAEALMAAEVVAGQLRRLPSIKRLEYAGSLRRGCETIGDIDLLVQTGQPAEVIKAFTQLPGANTVLAAGETKASIRFHDPNICSQTIQVDLRVVPTESMGATWQYFTGSKAHNVRLREIAVKKGYKLNEYGLFKDDKPIAGKTEMEIYKKLGLAYVPPTLREDRGEIELAQKKDLPELVQLVDICGDLHMHSPASDGHSTIHEMIEAARQHRYVYIAITDHSQSSIIANGLDTPGLLAHAERIKALNETLKDFTLLAGIEVDILMDGRLDYPDEVLAELDFVIASVHSGMRGDREKLTARIRKAMDNPYVNCLGHPTGRMIGIREPMDLDMQALVDHAVATGTALEVSSSPLRLDLKDIHCRMAVEAGAKLFINTDAHDTHGLDNISMGVATAQRGWVTKKDVLNCQPISTLRKWVQKKRSR